MPADRTTLARFLDQDRRRHPAAAPEPDRVVLEIARACAAIARRIGLGVLGGHELDAIAREQARAAARRSRSVTAIVSTGPDRPQVLTPPSGPGHHLLVVEPLDGPSGSDDLPMGTIFAVLRTPRRATGPDHLAPGTAQVCAGYALYGPATTLVLSVGHGVHAFTLDPRRREFVLTHEGLRIPGPARELAIDVANRRFWEPAVRRYVDECLAGHAGPRQRDFALRWGASLVAGTHRVLTRGGVLLHPRDVRPPAGTGLPRLLSAANPVAFLVEQAGGAASTGRERVLGVVPMSVHQRVPLVLGSADEVTRIEGYHRRFNDRPGASPLYGERGLFRATAS